ncbi:hypothetical protein QP580_03570 [Prevotella bivia]|uniref:hypothetical protein n=1 Tax=Prevotella bivia TaxID=28125 RepID=UPI002550406B|nr:hypothetical protein [Prevotella bivia]MDK7762534.1 hypothetical protein [Prevotella bivia]
MKNLITKACWLSLLLLGLTLSSCKEDNQAKAERLVNEYLQENLNDPSSYECIKMGKLGKITPMIVALVSIEKGCKERGYPNDSINILLERFKLMQEKAGKDPYSTMGWELSHKYRAKNAFGGYIITKCKYILDKDITHIESVETEK